MSLDEVNRLTTSGHFKILRQRKKKTNKKTKKQNKIKQNKTKRKDVLKM